MKATLEDLLFFRAEDHRPYKDGEPVFVPITQDFFKNQQLMIPGDEIHPNDYGNGYKVKVRSHNDEFDDVFMFGDFLLKRMAEWS